MFENRNGLDVLFVNGVNIEFGGANVLLMKVWEASFRKNNVTYRIFATVPRFKFVRKSKLYLFILALYFFPGTFFRLLKVPLFEFTYKFSPILIIRFIWNLVMVKPRKIIFSHHACYYLSLFVRRANRIFIIHDLLFIRAKSFGASRRMQRLYFSFELLVYRLAPTLLVLSYQESRILRRFLKSRIHLISCFDLETLPVSLSYQNCELAVVSDWRRQENVHGAIHFFSTKDAASYVGVNLHFRFFGFGSKELVDRLNLLTLSSQITITLGGIFNDPSDITEGYLFVPVYQGAGIKIKTIEFLSNYRLVVGTRAAFIGLPPWIISKVTQRVGSMKDLQYGLKAPEAGAFPEAMKSLSQTFKKIGETPGICSATSNV